MREHDPGPAPAPWSDTPECMAIAEWYRERMRAGAAPSLTVLLERWPQYRDYLIDIVTMFSGGETGEPDAAGSVCDLPRAELSRATLHTVAGLAADARKILPRVAESTDVYHPEGK